ncbi:MAG: hypothetical protein AB7O96_01315 [Pseudobdellovibrionaceae bacterium]
MENTIECENNEIFLLNRIVIDNYEKIIAEQAEKIRLLDQKIDLLNSISHLSTVLPDALRLSVAQNNKIETTFSPMVEKAMGRSVVKNRDKMAHIIFPLMGPAIRKAVAEAFKNWVQSVQIVVEQAFSWQGLKWRYESYVTGVTLAEVVLKHCLVYRIDHIFLIHRKSANILQQVHASGAVEMDRLTFSGMLEAVKDFAEDVFLKSEKIQLESIELGNLKILITEGPDALIAAVARGTIPSSVTQKICEISTDIFSRFSNELAKENPSPSLFISCDEALEECLLEQKTDFANEKARRTGPFLYMAAGIGVLLVLLVIYSMISEYSLRSRFKEFQTLSAQQKDVLVTGVERTADSYRVDVLAEDSTTAESKLRQLAKQAGLKQNELEMRVIKSFLVDNSDFLKNESRLNSLIEEVQKVELRSVKFPAGKIFIETVTPTLSEINRLAALNKQKVIVFFSHVPEYQKVAEGIMWVAFNRISNDRFTDYHFLRTRNNYLTPAPIIKLEVMKENLK